MKITKKVIEQYQELCPISSMKCNTYEEIRYKILRAVDLGKPVLLKDGMTVVRYHRLNFLIKGNRVVEMHKDSQGRTYYVSEKAKDEYDKIHMKVVV